MDRFKQLQTFVTVATRGSLAAAASLEGVTPAIVGRRIDALESRLGIKLMIRTTRRLSLTSEGTAFLEEAQRILHEMDAAESAAAAGGGRISGHLRITAPAGFGRRHVAPLIPRFVADHPGITLWLDLSDRITDLVDEGFDCAIRLGTLPDSSLVSVPLATNRRVVVASPAYLEQYGTPSTPDELAQHRCLTLGTAGHQRAWTFTIGRSQRQIRVEGTIACNDATALTQWALDGAGLAWRSLWEVGQDLRAGRLVEVLADHAAADNGIHAVVPQRKHLPGRVRAFIDHLRETYRQADYWDR
ncbi:LysR family transcriptional regulator [soil metagenome]